MLRRENHAAHAAGLQRRDDLVRASNDVGLKIDGCSSPNPHSLSVKVLVVKRRNAYVSSSRHRTCRPLGKRRMARSAAPRKRERVRPDRASARWRARRETRLARGASVSLGYRHGSKLTTSRSKIAVMNITRREALKGYRGADRRHAGRRLAARRADARRARARRRGDRARPRDHSAANAYLKQRPVTITASASPAVRADATISFPEGDYCGPIRRTQAVRTSSVTG